MCLAPSAEMPRILVDDLQQPTVSGNGERRNKRGFVGSIWQSDLRVSSRHRQVCGSRVGQSCFGNPNGVAVGNFKLEVTDRRWKKKKLIKKREKEISDEF